MATAHILILGAGAAGTAAARALAPHDGIRVTLVARVGEKPYTRMLVKNVAFGPTPADAIALPQPEVDVIADTAAEVDTAARTVRLSSGERLAYDALLVATGSAPRPLPLDVATEEAMASGRISVLHSLDDALSLRELLTGSDRPARVAIYGGGLIAAETASTLHADGYQVTLIARSQVPGISAFGRPVAERLAALHQAQLRTCFGQAVQHVEAVGSGVRITLDSARSLDADLLLLGLGTIPAAPDPWTGGVDVDDRLRSSAESVYAAGGVAVHHDDALGTWRIDHWSDATAQGVHAAESMLHGLGLAADPGAYLPRSPYMASIHGRSVSGAGSSAGTPNILEDGSELVVQHEQNGNAIGVTGIDAVDTIYSWAQRLHTASV
jgi:3-phenylpropionate/trans-cinnamate dioxygenase ferredoxin reductase subunit